MKPEDNASKPTQDYPTNEFPTVPAPPRNELPQNEPLDAPYAAVISGTVGAPKKSKKKILLLSGAVFLLAIATVGYVFAFYIPNKPANVWKASIDRTGEALVKMTSSVTEKSKIEAFNRSQIGGSAQFKTGDHDYSGSFKSTFDDRKADGGADITLKQKDQPDRTMSVKFLSELKESGTYPNVYLQVMGLKMPGLEGLEQMYPGIGDYDGKWIAIEEDYLKSVADQLAKGMEGQNGQTPTEQPTQLDQSKPDQAKDAKDEKITAEEISEAAKTIAATISEYVLTSNPNKAMFEQRSFVGKEHVEGVKAYHYKVGINKAHAKDMCKAMIERIATTKLYKKSPGYDANDQAGMDKIRDDLVKGCQDAIQNSKDRTFDLWADATYKLIYKIRFTNPDDSKIYYDFGQNYKGGDEVALFARYHNGTAESEGQLTLRTNLKTSETKVGLAIKSTKKDDVFEINSNLEAKPFKEEIKIEKPAGAIPVKDILDRYGIDPATLNPLALIGSQPGYSEDVLGPTDPATQLPIIYTN